MSDSYKKNAYHSYVKSKEDKQIHSRRIRHRLKQYINTRTDWDDFLLPKIYPDDWWWNDFYCNCPYNIPAINECQVKAQKYNLWREDYAEYYREFDGEHMKGCNCYTNKRGRWWKAKRK